jgi:hypothetical protein
MSQQAVAGQGMGPKDAVQPQYKANQDSTTAEAGTGRQKDSRQ